MEENLKNIEIKMDLLGFKYIGGTSPHIFSGRGRLTVLGNIGLLSCTGKAQALQNVNIF